MTDVIKCLACARGFTDECLRDIPCGTKEENNITETNVGFINKYSGTPDTPPPVAKKVGRPVKTDEDDIKDPHSTGRKRAAALYPLDKRLQCEWRDHINCGGGRYPIAGCTTGLQENLHHGPDKHTLNNSRNNIHKICSNCHNRWHAANDPEYDDSCRTMQHSPILFTSALELITKFTFQKGKDIGNVVATKQENK